MATNFLDINGDPVLPNVGVDGSLYNYFNTPLDVKLSNYYISMGLFYIESVDEYLARVVLEERAMGAVVVFLMPKVGYTPSGPYQMVNIATALTNYDVKYYSFIDGIADENFVEVTMEKELGIVLEDGTNPFIKKLKYTYGIDVFEVGDVPKSHGLAKTYTVTRTGDLSFSISAINYYIKGTAYSVSAGSVTLNAPDALYSRFDVIVVNTSGTFQILQGEPSVNPQKPEIDPTLYIEVTTVLVNAVPSTETPTEIRWSIVSTTCLLDGNLDNTGQQQVVKQKEVYNAGTDTWDYAGETITETITNTEDCPTPEPPAPDPFRVAVNVGQTWNGTTATEFAYSASRMRVYTPVLAGYNYPFISTPTAKGKPVFTNNMGIDISDMFTSVTTDTKAGYQDNTVWKFASTIATERASTFYVTIG